MSEFLLCCILSKFYIKPQPEATSSKTPTGCILSKFYIKPQPPWATVYEAFGCILSKFYIKPQLNRDYGDEASVVSYRNSTSNHNFVGSVRIFVVLYLIEILHQTTTTSFEEFIEEMLYLIEILHQTTTLPAASLPAVCCILSKFYIKPQLKKMLYTFAESCILSKFYIKPQLIILSCVFSLVVSYRNSTSNHNPCMLSDCLG